MNTIGPIVIGGNGHSGTRVFCDIITSGGVFTGVEHVTKRSESADLKIIDLLNKWVEPYVYNRMDDLRFAQMRHEFARRLRLYFPFRRAGWGFKNPRTMLVLPFLDQVLDGMKFLHVIRDGRDIALGNPFVNQNPYVDAYLADDERQLRPEEKMVLFWGRSNQAARDYGARHMGSRYMQVRWEDLCQDPLTITRRVYEFAECRRGLVEDLAKIVRKPSSLGRWKTYPQDLRDSVVARGCQWLTEFGYE